MSRTLFYELMFELIFMAWPISYRVDSHATELILFPLKIASTTVYFGKQQLA